MTATEAVVGTEGRAGPLWQCPTASPPSSTALTRARLGFLLAATRGLAELRCHPSPPSPLPVTGGSKRSLLPPPCSEQVAIFHWVSPVWVHPLQILPAGQNPQALIPCGSRSRLCHIPLWLPPSSFYSTALPGTMAQPERQERWWSTASFPIHR